jgi:drug/metabolite transporter (DMT)-like permease
MEPIFGSLSAFAILGERFTRRALTGALLIMAGVLSEIMERE